MYSRYIYILKCSDGSYYAGITNDLTRRFGEHQSGYKKQCYTYKRRPLTMEFYQEFNDVLQEIYFEKKIKGWTSAKKMALINGDGFDSAQPDKRDVTLSARMYPVGPVRIASAGRALSQTNSFDRIAVALRR